MQNFTRFLAKNAEHTQGVQGEHWSPGRTLSPDQSHWSNAQFARVHNGATNAFFQGDYSWIEARKFNALALEALGEYGGLAEEIRRELDELAAWKRRPPSTDGLARVPVVGAGAPISFGGMEIGLARDGSLGFVRLGEGKGDSVWADGSNNNSGLFQLAYVTYNAAEKWDGKVNLSCAEAGCANPEDKVWAPRLDGLWHNCSGGGGGGGGKEPAAAAASCRVVTRATFNTTAHDKYGAPTAVWGAYTLEPRRNASGSIAGALSWFDKRTTRLPESIMVSFRPKRRAGFRFEMDVLGEWVATSEVAAGTTNPWQRAVWRGVRYVDARGQGLTVETLDAALACPIVPGVGLLGDASPMGEGNPAFPAGGGRRRQQQQQQHAAVQGVSINLLNNLMPISGFAQWYPFGTGAAYQMEDEASVFRFQVQ